uniref:Uncharacterized protein n=1 Tax=Setaria viridis TaxID=4556 RepID=A0A4U6UR93_SETVI|nr:hypothetical protein SEVIR_5G303000v2 [Setaria viridis]TKW16499.1 hypothetical protein SEVIR_5G303000v2 [Setaria viridis]TKW16500.1 hypothetical protein SEVIR_5G303000v2 [Setaria viridis]
MRDLHTRTSSFLYAFALIVWIWTSCNIVFGTSFAGECVSYKRTLTQMEEVLDRLQTYAIWFFRRRVCGRLPKRRMFFSKQFLSNSRILRQNLLCILALRKPQMTFAAKKDPSSPAAMSIAIDANSGCSSGSVLPKAITLKKYQWHVAS